MSLDQHGQPGVDTYASALSTLAPRPSRRGAYPEIDPVGHLSRAYPLDTRNARYAGTGLALSRHHVHPVKSTSFMKLDTIVRVDGKTRELRRVSKELLGSSYRLEVAVAVNRAPGGQVYAHQLVDAVPGARDNQVAECLKHFEQGGLLKRNATRGGRNPQTFDIVASVYWEFCEKLSTEVKKR
jgi:hypothetical protein